MNALFAFAGLEVWHIAGWTMLHFLWLGMLVGAMAIVLRLLLRRAAANVRYAAALCCLMLLAALPVGIATWLTISPPFQNPPLAVGESHGEGDLLDEVDRRTHATAQIAQPMIELKERDPAPTDSSAPGRRSAVAGSAGGFADEQHSRGEPFEYVAPLNPRQSRGLFGFRNTLESCVPYLPWLWIIGTPITFALLATGIIGTKRLRNTSRAIDDPRIAELMSRLTASLRIGRRVSIAICERIASPVLIGIVRPIILLPPAALTGWSPDEIEMVLLHELAHIRRWDNLVNLMQRLVESLLFFHPAVWLISTWVRRERESCCDAFVVRRTERPHAYAELLLNLAAVHPPLAGLAFARHPLRTRIRRILQLEDDPMLISGKSLAISFAALLVAATLAVLYLPTIGQAEESTTEVTEDTEDIESRQPIENAPASSETIATNSAESKDVATTTRDRDAETDFQLRKVDELQKKKIALVKALHELQTSYEVLKGRLDNTQPAQERELTKEFQINSDSLWKQLKAIEKALDETSETSNSVPTSLTAEPEVVATLQADAFTTNEFRQAYEAARKKKQHVDLVSRDNHSVLVIVPKPNESNWPDVLGATPRKDRVIADKAYARLGLKLAPITNAESAYRQITGKPTGVLIVGGNVPKGLPLPSLLTQIGTPVERFRIENMDGMLSWLESHHGQAQSSVKCYATADDNEYLFETAPPAPQPAAAASQPSPRPTLQFLFFHSRTSQPSKEMQPIAEKVAKQFPAAQFQLVNASQSPNLARKYDVDAIPTCLIVRNGKVIARLVGLLPEEMIRKTVEASVESAVGQTPQAPNDPQSDLPKYELPSPDVEAAEAPKPRSRNRRVAVPATATKMDAHQQGAESAKSALRYDGKSFGTWRDTWRTELSIEKRLEAVKALAAFGARGYGHEAAEAILEVAAEYEARAINNDTPEGRLMQAVVDGLATKVPASEWRPLLRKRFDADPKQWQWLAIATLREVEPSEENEKKETQDFLLVLARNDVGAISWNAVSALVKLDPALENAETKQLVMERLNSDQLNAVRQILSDLSGTPQHPPELIDLLLHGDPQQQKLVRQALDRSPPWKANLALVDSLTAVLKDETKAADHLATIRALAALGQAAQRAESKPLDVLQAIVNDGNAEFQVAAAVAIDQISRGQIGDWPQLTGKLRDADGNDLDAAAIQKLTQTEREEVFGKNAK